MYGNSDTATLGGYPAATLSAQKLGVREVNSVGEQGLGGCDGRDENGLYVLTERAWPAPPAFSRTSSPRRSRVVAVTAKHAVRVVGRFS